MYDEFSRAYRAFQECGAQDPLFETFRLFDLLSKGALGNIDLSFPAGRAIGLDELARKRKAGMPLEYVLGGAAFMGRIFSCTPDTLIPTQETRALVDVALNTIEERQKERKAQTIIDMGTGCGNVAITVALGSRDTKILASDVSEGAVAVARGNVRTFDLQDRVSLFCGDLFAPFTGSEFEGNIDVVMCNPPYIPTGSLGKLGREITDHEPIVALDAGPYGIDFYRRLAADALPMLKRDGVLVFEIGVGQEKLATRVLEKNGGYEDIAHFKLGEETRVIRAVGRPQPGGQDARISGR